MNSNPRFVLRSRISETAASGSSTFHVAALPSSTLRAAYGTESWSSAPRKPLRFANWLASGGGSHQGSAPHRMTTARPRLISETGSMRRRYRTDHATAKNAPIRTVSFVRLNATMARHNASGRSATTAIAIAKSSRSPNASTLTTSHARYPTTGGASATTVPHTVALVDLTP